MHAAFGSACCGDHETTQRSVVLAVAAAAASKIALAGWLVTMRFLETGQTPVAPENIFRRTTISLYILKYILVSIVRNNQCRRFTFFT